MIPVTSRGRRLLLVDLNTIRVVEIPFSRSPPPHTVDYKSSTVMNSTVECSGFNYIRSLGSRIRDDDSDDDDCGMVETYNLC